MKPGLGPPAVGNRRAAVQRPLPVRPAVELVGQPADLGLLLGVGVEVGRAGEHPGEQEGRVDRRQLALPDAATGLHVEEVVVEALVARGIRLRSLRAVAEEAQWSQRDLGGELAGDHAAFDEHRDARQAEPHGGDAGAAPPGRSCRGSGRWPGWSRAGSTAASSPEGSAPPPSEDPSDTRPLVVGCSSWLGPRALHPDPALLRHGARFAARPAQCAGDPARDELSLILNLRARRPGAP